MASLEKSAPPYDENIFKKSPLSNNRNPTNHPPPPPLTTIGNPLSIPIAVNLEDESEVEFDPAKLITDNAEDIDNKNYSRNQIWNN